ncbi:MAG: sigma-54 dependent transcriptional regulator [Desulfobacterales bacterium]|jgi:DNA-binding NtrC family response regulator
MQDFEILFVDDDRAILELVKEYLATFDYHVHVVDNGLKALELIKDKKIDVVFTDFKMPDIDGLELLAVIKEYRPETEVIMVTGHGTMESAIKAMKYGSYDYIQKPFKLDVLKILIDKIYEEKKLKQENVVLRTRLKERHRYADLVGISLRMQEIYDKIDRMGQNIPNVIIEGESGTGKELTAHVIHKRSDRGHKPLIAVNCKNLGKGLPEERMYDHAVEIFKSADRGTLYFDEIADVNSTLQVEICRAYRETTTDTGRVVETPVADVRLLAVTSRNLKAAVEKHVLNKEFISCFDDVVIQMPALRDRKEDICLLINHFLNRANAESQKKILNVSAEALDLLLRYNWPGNVIQLENVIERAFALGVDLIINVDDLPAEIKTFGEASKMA